ncbi:hypothetical protein B4113_3843 [Geobacillus sp. B4113_201601]|nr:hypothetical protein B4113_3843 [Geobacillus sp. B4113_201601]
MSISLNEFALLQGSLLFYNFLKIKKALPNETALPSIRLGKNR